MQQFHDIEKTCECGMPFTWTAGEQRFMNQLFDEGKIKQVSEPKRCTDCRAKKKKKFEGKERESDSRRERVY